MKIIFMGDSITEGVGLKDKANRFSDLITNELHIDSVNRGLGGDTTNGMMIRLFPEVFTQKPDAMVFFGGVNDRLCAVFQPAEAAQAGVDEHRVAGADAQFLKGRCDLLHIDVHITAPAVLLHFLRL